MKKYLPYTFLFSVIVIFISSAPSQEKHIGRWKTKRKHEVKYITLDKEGYATIEENGYVLEGKSHQQFGIEMRMIYKINYNVFPATIDFILLDAESGVELRTTSGILQFITDDKMQIAAGEGNRPTTFTHENSDIYEKVK